MRPLRVVTTEDHQDLALENELLRHEVIHVRARMAAAIEGRKRADARAEHQRQRAQEQQKRAEAVLGGKERARGEVARLRAQVARQQSKLNVVRDRKRRADREIIRLTQLASSESGGPTNAQLADAETARNDLVWLLQRLDNSPARWVLRRYAGYRKLHAKHVSGRV